jgi:branched-chain amino acid transport system permease protein
VQQFVTLTLNGIILGSVFAAFALTLVLIFRATRIINFGQGAQAMFSTFIALKVIESTGSYWLGFVAALASGFVIGGLVERLIVRRVEGGPELNAVIVTLGLFVGFIALASILFGNTFQGLPERLLGAGLRVGGHHPERPLQAGRRRHRDGAAAGPVPLHRPRPADARRRLRPGDARLLGVKVGQLLTLGWALAGLFGALAGILIASGAPISPNYMDAVVVFGFVAAVLGGLDSFLGAVVGGLVLGLTNTYVSGYVQDGSALTALAALAILVAVLLLRPQGLFSSSVARKV